MKRERLVLTGLAAVFLVELAIGIPAAFRKDTGDEDVPATPAAITAAPVPVVTHALAVAETVAPIGRVMPLAMPSAAPVTPRSISAVPSARVAAPARAVPKRTAATIPATRPPAQVAFATAPPPRRVRVVDDLPQIGATATFSYLGHWEHARALSDGRTAGTSSRSFKPKSSAILNFRGTRIRLFGVCGPQGGRAIVAIDGRSAASPINFFSPVKETHMLVYHSPRLPAGLHRLSITVPAAARTMKRRYVNIDGAEYDS